MVRVKQMGNESRPRSQSRVPRDSALFEKIIPALLIAMSVLMIVLIGVAAGVLLGLIHF